MGLSHQLCVAHVRKYVEGRSKSIFEQAQREWRKLYPEKLGDLEGDLKRLKDILNELEEERSYELRRLHSKYSGASPPDRGENASAAYRMRMLTLEVWNKWGKLLLHLRKPKLGLDGTNNASERSIGRSKVRYKTMRGYKSVEGMMNGIALTQWLYSGEGEHDLGREMAA